MIDMKSDHFFEISCHQSSVDHNNIVRVVKQGIDARLTAFTKSEFKYTPNKLFCWVHNDELEILIRRLLELDSDNADSLANGIVLVKYGYEVI
jgi:hypothetical protein